MPVALVSALFLHPGGEFRHIDKYKGHFEQLAALGIPIYLFLDPRLREYGEELERKWGNVKVLVYMDVDKRFLPADGRVILPRNRHPVKDTVDYMCIQLMKLRVMMMAAILVDPEFTHLAWIDFGIFHMFKDPAGTGKVLRDICAQDVARWPTDKILSPSCWPAGKYDIWSSICWRHCGSFLLGRRELFGPAYERQAFLVNCNLPGLTWEVNYWNEMPEYFQTYSANHDDSVILADKKESA